QSRPAYSARRSPGVDSPSQRTFKCSGSRNSGRAISVTRGSRKISIGCRVSGVGGIRERRFRRRPGGGPLQLAQPGRDVVCNRGGGGGHLEVEQRRPIGGGQYN